MKRKWVMGEGIRGTLQQSQWWGREAPLVQSIQNMPGSLLRSLAIRMRNPSAPLVNYIPSKRYPLTLDFIFRTIICFFLFNE